MRVRTPFAKSSFTASFTEVWRIRAIGYSTGSSRVMMLIPSWSRWARIEYRVVVLPLPVGPVTRITPSGRSIIRRSAASAWADMPSSPRATIPRLRSSTRSTMFSPCAVGREDTR